MKFHKEVYQKKMFKIVRRFPENRRSEKPNLLPGANDLISAPSTFIYDWGGGEGVSGTIDP